MSEAIIVEPQEQRHASLYLPEGDLVISASVKKSKTPIIQIFRIFRAFLAWHSPIFKDMLALGQGSSNEMYDDVPRVHLPDHAEDVADFLNALHNPDTLPLLESDPDLPLKVTGTMKLAVKYDVAMLRTMIVRAFENQWPRTLVEWERQQHARVVGKMPLSESDIDQYEGYISPGLSSWDLKKLPDPAAAIHFARSFNCPDILPAAFYELIQTGLVLNWDRVKDDWITTKHRPARWRSLDVDDLSSVISGKKRLDRLLMDSLNLIRWEVRKECVGNDDDDDDAGGRVESICVWTTNTLILTHILSDTTSSCMDPLNVMRCITEDLGTDWDEKKNEGRWCCTEGYTCLRQQLRKHAQKIWDDLPRILHVEQLTK